MGGQLYTGLCKLWGAGQVSGQGAAGEIECVTDGVTQAPLVGKNENTFGGTQWLAARLKDLKETALQNHTWPGGTLSTQRPSAFTHCAP